MNKIYTLIFALSIINLHAGPSEVDELMRQAFWDAKKQGMLGSTASFKQKDRHKRTVANVQNGHTVTVEFDYATAPQEIKNAAEQAKKKAEDEAANSKSLSWRSTLPAQIKESLVFDENTMTQCTLNYKRSNNEEGSTIVCSLTATFNEFLKEKNKTDSRLKAM